MTNFLAIVTAYCACTTCCGPNAKGITASGVRPVAGITIAAPRSVPFGTRIKVAGFTNIFIAQDRTARRFNGRFDIYFNSHAEARRFGIKTNTIIIL